MKTAACVAAAAAALLALAGAALGPGAVLLAVPAAFAGALVQRRIAVREGALRRLSLRDALTGLANRRALEERMDYEIARHGRHRRRFAVIALDLDGFKLVNDRFGHAAGDEVLREIAGALEDAVREQDTVVRLGGDEFCVLAPESGADVAERLMDRLSVAVAEAVDGLEGMSVSAGWAVFPEDGLTAEDLLAVADQAAIEAKRRVHGGRTSRRAA
ncbi:MAG TPA: GGDEF domain-containing protein [Solirubrobacteraceae bacterium]|nr:GGDEF domain-containing protein [Solirubrobacteraceae bacterium]